MPSFDRIPELVGQRVLVPRSGSSAGPVMVQRVGNAGAEVIADARDLAPRARPLSC